MTPMLVRKRGMLIMGISSIFRLGREIDEDLGIYRFVSPLTSWSTSLKGLSIPNSILNLQSVIG